MTDHLESLERLAGLFERGIISKEEFDDGKSHFLAAGRQGQNAGAMFWQVRRNWIASACVIAGVMLVWALIKLLSADLDQRLTSKSKVQSGTGPIYPVKTRIQDVLEFLPGPSCNPSPSFSRLLERVDMAAADSVNDSPALVEVRRGATPIEFSIAHLEDGASLSEASLDAPWHSLRLAKVRRLSWPNGTGFQLRFTNNLSEVQAVFQHLGIKANEKPNDRLEFVKIDFAEGSANVTCLRSNAFSVPNRSFDSKIG